MSIPKIAWSSFWVPLPFFGTDFITPIFRTIYRRSDSSDLSFCRKTWKLVTASLKFFLRKRGWQQSSFYSSFKFFCNYLILKGLSKMLIFKKINNFNMLHKFQEKTWNSSFIPIAFVWIVLSFILRIHLLRFLLLKLPYVTILSQF